MVSQETGRDHQSNHPLHEERPGLRLRRVGHLQVSVHCPRHPANGVKAGRKALEEDESRLRCLDNRGGRCTRCRADGRGRIGFFVRPTLDIPAGGSTMRRLIGPAVIVALVVTTILIGPADAQKKGGVLRIGNLGEPPSLDPHWGTQTITEVLTNHIFQGLYSLDEGYQPIPMLADGMPAVSRDGLTYTFKLRQGIKFHNGKEMTSADVVASLVRWGKRSVYGKSLFNQVADFKATDKYTVELKLKEKSAIVLVSLAVPNNFGAIYPQEIAEKYPPDQRITEW